MSPRPPFTSDLFYAVQNEDYQTEWELLAHLPHQEGLRLLLIASSGENALSLLCHPAVSTIHAVDINPAQIHLCHLRAQAAKILSRDDQLRLLGAIPPDTLPETVQERLDLYRHIRSFLPPLSCTYWDEREKSDIAFGVHHVGRNDQIMHDLQYHLAQAGFVPLISLHDENTLPQWLAVYTTLMTSAYIQTAFGLPSVALAEKIAGIAPYLGSCHFHAIRTQNAHLNPYITTAFANSYAIEAGEAGFPLYLQQRGQAFLQSEEKVPHLQLHTGNLLEKMTQIATTEGKFDLISISNIADWLNETQFTTLLLQVKQSLQPDGAFLARTATPNPMIQKLTGEQLRTDEKITHKLIGIERGPWFQRIAAGFNP